MHPGHSCAVSPHRPPFGVPGTFEKGVHVMRNLHPALALVALVALPMALAADSPPAKISAVAPTTASVEPRLIHVTRLEHADARELGGELAKIFSVGPPPAGGTLAVVPDAETNSLILSGTTA